MALIIGACLALMAISKSSEFAGGSSAIVVGFDYRGLVASLDISKSTEFAGVGSAVVVGFAYLGLPYINGYF